jgi:hypothetical protein
VATLINQELIASLGLQLSGHKHLLLEYENLLGEHRLLTKQLEVSERAKSNFVSNIRNKIINPFRLVLGFAESIGQLSEGQIGKAQSIASPI